MKFEVLRKQFPTADIPEFNNFSDISTMTYEYDSWLKKLLLDHNVDQYRNYLIAGFVIVEILGTNILKIDMSGYAKQQMINMDKYQLLLVELGEKNYLPEGTSIPVELRILWMMVMQGGLFVFSKVAFKNTGTNVMNMFNRPQAKPSGGGGSGGGIGGMAPVAATSADPGGKRKMRGPSLDINNLPV